MASDAKDRLIIALDVASAADAQALVQRIGNVAGFYKVGLQLFSAEGPQIVRDLIHSGKKVFLDLKLHDIPHTVAGAVRSASELGVHMLTVHASGGTRMLAAAVEAAGHANGANSAPQILAVTMLTSIGETDLPALGLGGASIADQVIRLAKIARDSGCAGVVASPQEISQLRRTIGNEMLIVTPGIRPSSSPTDDQARTATPLEAIRAGATHLVVGRPITSANDPAKAACAILEEMHKA